MAKWTALLTNLKQKKYEEASKELQSIHDYDDLQDALQLIPFKTLNADLPESLRILERLYTKFISLTNNKEEGRLIIRHVFKVDGFLANVIRTQVRDAVLGRTSGPSMDKDSVDHITQITWNMDSSIVKELMTRLTRIKSVLKHFQQRPPVSPDIESSHDEIISDLKCSLAKYDSVIRRLDSLVKGGTIKDSEESCLESWSKIECGSCRDMMEQIRKRSMLNQTILEVVEPCKGTIEQGPTLLQSLRVLIESDQKFLEVMTELSIDISCYGDILVEKVVEQYMISYKSVLSAVAPVNEPEYHGQRSNSLDCGKDRSLVNNGLKIEVNGSPFRRNFDAKRLHVRDKRERKEPLRSHSCREPRKDELTVPVNDSSKEEKSDGKLKDMLILKEKQLEETRSLVKNLKKREEQLLEKLTEQAKINLMNSEKFENISQDTPRVDYMVKQYDDLYSQFRLDALDDLDNINSFDSLEGCDEIKSQVTFAVITVSFHLAQQEIETRRKTIYSLLNVDNTNTVSSTLRSEISLQLRRSAATIDLQHVVQEVCNGLCTTMFDFPELESCDQLRRFVEACVRFSWSICAHVPPLTITYDSTKFNASLHSKSHHSDKHNDEIKHYVWPALVESEDKTVLYKAIVVT